MLVETLGGRGLEGGWFTRSRGGAESCALCFVISKNLPYYGSKIVAEYQPGPNFFDSQLF